MGRRGPPKTPATVLKQRKTFRGDRHSDDVEKTAKAVIPKAPTHLSAKARAVWKVLAPKLKRCGLLTELDGISFEVLCTSYADTVAAAKKLTPDELVVYVGESMTPMANPLVGIISKNLATLKWAIAQYGLSPAARTGIRTAKQAAADTDPMDDLLGAP